MNPTNPPKNVINCLQTILDAIAVGNYELFLTVGDSDYKAGITLDMFNSVSSQLAPRMSVGYTITYLGHLKQQYQTYLWKLSFVDGKDEFLARMAMNRDKVAGILIT
ncbi:MAG: hypothetical protein KME32_28955 [Mojavia pulchra JT2-VF2]|jgi:hypothetical protein|uniref:Uncharacterized protein n=1 Tax=Mojavia pulchra JT2-VF2 TaxID=287848 RepID=A0A951UK57_9NOST|nr:hypothetical protein [Mojavia pulchra JT2-VF2]